MVRCHDASASLAKSLDEVQARESPGAVTKVAMKWSTARSEVTVQLTFSDVDDLLCGSRQAAIGASPGLAGMLPRSPWQNSGPWLHSPPPGGVLSSPIQPHFRGTLVPFAGFL